MSKTENGFTLVEILIVTGIIALLAAIAIPNFLKARQSANETSAQGTLKSISTALENYYASNSAYPLNTSLLLGVTPPYLNVDYFVGTHHGYTFGSVLSTYAYTITASPVTSSSGLKTFTISTGGVLQEF